MKRKKKEGRTRIIFILYFIFSPRKIFRKGEAFKSSRRPKTSRRVNFYLKEILTVDGKSEKNMKNSEK